METRHIKLDYEEALLAKKQLLSAELSILQTARKIKNYKILRKKELSLKNKFKNNLRSLRTQINSLQSALPQEDSEGSSRFKIRRKKIEKRKMQDIKEQLEEIQEKLAQLQ